MNCAGAVLNIYFLAVLLLLLLLWVQFKFVFPPRACRRDPHVAVVVCVQEIVRNVQRNGRLNFKALLEALASLCNVRILVFYATSVSLPLSLSLSLLLLLLPCVCVCVCVCVRVCVRVIILQKHKLIMRSFTFFNHT